MVELPNSQNPNTFSRRYFESQLNVSKGYAVENMIGEGGVGRAYKVVDRAGAARVVKVRSIDHI